MEFIWILLLSSRGLFSFASFDELRGPGVVPEDSSLLKNAFEEETGAAGGGGRISR